jgi:hypothetical protein
MATCAGSGKKVLKKESWNIRDKYAAWSDCAEGWRTTCPACYKVCGVGPLSKAIQKHQAAQPKLSAAEVKAQKQASLDAIYHEVYERGLKGEGGLRPDTYSPGLKINERDIWVMAYLDGLGDGGHNMKAGAFKRWLAKN